MKLIKHLSFYVLLAVSIYVTAHQDDDLSGNGDPEVDLDSELLGISNGITLESPASTPSFSAEFQSNTDGEKVSIKRTFHKNGGISEEGYSKMFQYSYGLEGKLNKDDEFSDLATLDGLSNSSNFSLGIKWMLSGGFKTPQELALGCNFVELEKKMVGQCITIANRLTGSEQADAVEQCNTGTFNFDAPEYQALLNNKSFAIENGTEKIENIFSRCDPRLPKDNKENPPDVHFWGAQLKYGHEKFKFLSSSDFSENSDTVAPRSLGAYYGYIWPDHNKSLLFGLDYQKTYKSADEQTLCKEDINLNLIECKTSPFAAPSKATNKLAFLQYRFNSKKYAIEPRITRDFESDAIGYDIPILLLKNKKELFNSGVRIGYRDDTDDLSFGIFIGSPFSHYATK